MTCSLKNFPFVFFSFYFFSERPACACFMNARFRLTVISTVHIWIMSMTVILYRNSWRRYYIATTTISIGNGHVLRSSNNTLIITCGSQIDWIILLETFPFFTPSFPVPFVSPSPIPISQKTTTSMVGLAPVARDSPIQILLQTKLLKIKHKSTFTMVVVS